MTPALEAVPDDGAAPGELAGPQERRASRRDIEPARPRAQGTAPIYDEFSGDQSARPTRSRTAPLRRGPVKILFVAANARSGEHLSLDAEYRAIEQSIGAARHRDKFQLIPKLAARLSDLQQALLEHSPDVVHFAGHGSPHAELVFIVDEAGTAPVPATALASIFEVLQDNLTLVVFNACFASKQAAAIRRSAGLAIGMRSRIEDHAAIAFSSSLYGALAYGRSVRDAFDLGVAAVEAVDPRQQELPRLLARDGLDARDVYLVTAGRCRLRSRIAGAVACCVLLALAWFFLSPDRMDVPSPPVDDTTSPSAPPPTRHGSSDAPDVLDAPTRAAPLVLQHALHVEGSRNGVLRNGDTVVSRDRILVSVLTSEDAYLYLAYCSKDRKLDVFPVRGSIRTRAGKRAFAPDRTAAIVLDDNTGPETLYVIVSRLEIASAGQYVIKAAAAWAPNAVATDCGTRARGKTLDAGLERGGEVIWNGVPAVSADAGGIVVLRYGLQHVAAVAPLR